MPSVARVGELIVQFKLGIESHHPTHLRSSKTTKDMEPTQENV